jgi:hypothetical protein
MSQRRPTLAALIAVIALVVTATAGGLALSGRGPDRAEAGETSGEVEGADEGGADEGGAEEAREQAESTAERVDAWHEAKAAGRLRVTQLAAAAPAAGWAGQSVISPTADDWEPAIAADPSAPYVYLLSTRYTGPTACGNKCPLPYMMLKVSTDGGVTWGPDRYLCTCAGVGGQFDPIIEVVPNTGAVYAAWMNGFNVMFSKSTNHGATWSTPVKTYGKVSWNDKPVMAVSDNGNDVYVSWNGPQNGDPYVAESHDAGGTWTQTKVVNGTRYFFAFDGDVLPNGTVVFSETSLDYGGPGGSLVGQAEVNVLRKATPTSGWTATVVDTVELEPDCVAAGCSADFYNGHSAIAADAAGNLTLLYEGSTVSKGNATMWVRRSTNGGASWTARTAISTAGEEASFPAMEARGANDVRAWYMQTSGGGNQDAWNVWYRASTDGGVTWSAPVKISDASAGAAPYVTASGFLEPYGDYGEAAITNGGKFIGIWAEGNSYNGPGGVWLNRQL